MICPCGYCAAMRRMHEQAVEEVEDLPIRSAKEGLFGARRPGSKSRFREFSTPRYVLFVSDSFHGRMPGNHGFVTWPRPMPKPDFVVRAKELRIVEELKVIASRVRIPEQKLDDADDYRRELVAEAFVHALCDVDPADAIQRAVRTLRKLYRELA